MALANTDFFLAASGRNPIMDFIDGLAEPDAAAIFAAIEAFAMEFRHVVAVVTKPLLGKLWEMRVGRFRVLYGVAPDTLLIVHIFAKKTRKTPARELDLAEKRLKAMMEERQ